MTGLLIKRIAAGLISAAKADQDYLRHRMDLFDFAMLSAQIVVSGYFLLAAQSQDMNLIGAGILSLVVAVLLSLSWYFRNIPSIASPSRLHLCILGLTTVGLYLKGGLLSI